MPYVRGEMYVDSDEVLESMSIDEIKEYLDDRIRTESKKSGGTPTTKITTLDEDVLVLIEDFKFGRPIDDDVRAIADRHYGKIL